MLQWPKINYRTILLLTILQYALPAALSRPACGAPPSNGGHLSPNKKPVLKTTVSSEMDALSRLPQTEGVLLIDPSTAPISNWKYRCAPYVNAAVRLQALGKDKACQDLLELAKQEDTKAGMSGYRAITLCRMLFVPHPSTTFRRAMTGASHFLAGTTYTDWPLEPIILIDQVPFLITQGMGYGDIPESSGSYVQYCIDNCDWSTTQYHPVTQAQEAQALRKLYALPVWKGGLSDDDKAFFSQQIAPLPNPNQGRMHPDLAYLYHLPLAESMFDDASSSYRCAPYVDAAVHLQTAGKAKACRDLLSLANWEDDWNNGSPDQLGYRAIILCRMLFVARAGSTFRRAKTGDAYFFASTTYTDWPLEPIVLINQVPFITVVEYVGGTRSPEANSHYVQYCIDHCDWSSTKYHPLTRKQQEKALQKLYALPVWKGGLTAYGKAFFARQIAPVTK